MAGQQHIIENQAVELSCPDDNTAIRAQRLVETLCRDRLWPALEKWLDEKVPSGSTITIERLEVDLGHFRESQLRDQLPERLIGALERILARAATEGQHGRSAFTRGSAAYPDAEAQLIGDKRQGRSSLDALLFYLSRGYLPWWAGATAFAAIGPFHAEATLLEPQLKLAPGFGRQLMQLARQDEQAFKRLLYGFSVGFLWNVFRELLPELGGEPRQVLANVGLFLDGLNEEPWVSEGFSRRAVRLLLEMALMGVAENYYSRLFLFLEAECRRSGLAFSAWFEDAMDRASGKKGALSQGLYQGILSRIRAEIEKRGIRKSDRPAVGREDGRSKGSKPGDKAGANGHAEVTETDNPQRSIPKSTHPEEGESIYIENAGLVLLHPFIAELLRSLKWVKGHAFAGEENHQKAVLLLEYLAGKSLQPPEYTLSLNKILCGLELRYPIDVAGLVLEEAEQEAADELLTAVVGHWKALRGSSIDALRANFLQREGKLQRKDKSWKLTVEKKPQDILLDQLPWGFSIIRLPWMQENLYVDWA